MNLPLPAKRIRIPRRQRDATTPIVRVPPAEGSINPHAYGETRRVHRRSRALILIALMAIVLPLFAQTGYARPLPQKKDYLSDEEADKIRDADTPAERMTLFISFADDRLKKFQYEWNWTAPERNRTEILNSLMNAYAGCLDDAADQIDLAQEKQLDIRDALKLMRTKGKEFLDILQRIDKDGPDLDSYRDTLEDAIEGTKDALSDAADAGKTMPPAPVRRKPSP